MAPKTRVWLLWECHGPHEVSNILYEIAQSSTSFDQCFQSSPQNITPCKHLRCLQQIENGKTRQQTPHHSEKQFSLWHWEQIALGRNNAHRRIAAVLYIVIFLANPPSFCFYRHRGLHRIQCHTAAQTFPQVNTMLAKSLFPGYDIGVFRHICPKSTRNNNLNGTRCHHDRPQEMKAVLNDIILLMLNAYWPLPTAK